MQQEKNSGPVGPVQGAGLLIVRVPARSADPLGAVCGIC